MLVHEMIYFTWWVGGGRGRSHYLMYTSENCLPIGVALKERGEFQL